MMNRRFHLAITLAAVLLPAAVNAPPACAGAPVTDVTIASQGEFVVLTVVGGGNLLCDQFSEPAAGSRPFRIVLDFCDAEHAIGNLNFESLPNCRVARVRTSQFATQPRSIVRVVLDMKGEATYSVNPSGASLVVRISDPGHAPFAVWHANPKAAPVMAQEKPAPAPVVAMQDPKPAATPAAKPVEPKATPKAEKPVVVAEKPAVEKPVVEKPASAKPAPVQPAEPVIAQEPVVPVAPPSAVKRESKSLPLPPVPLVLAPDAGEPKQPATVSVESMKPMGPETIPAGPDGKPTAQTQSPAPAMWATTSPAPGSPSAKPEPAAPGAARAVSPVSPAAEALEQPSGTLLERLKTKFFGDVSQPRPYTTIPGGVVPGQEAYGPPSPNAGISREELLERIRTAQQRAVGGAAGDTVYAGVGSVPSRALLFYDDMGRRDPFAPLVSGQRSGFTSDALPNLENLRLVGVLRDDVESLALLENLEGYSYILRVGDPVQNGTLMAIQPTRALFRIDDYGWQHVVALQLTSRGTDPSKSLGAVQQVFPTYEDKKSEGTTQPKGSEGE